MTLNVNDTSLGSPAASAGLPLDHYPALVAELLANQPVDGLHLARAYANAAGQSGTQADQASSDMCLSRALSANGQMVEALEAALEAAGKYERLNSPLLQAAAEADAGQYSLALGEYEQASRLLNRAIGHAEDLDDLESKIIEAKSLNNLAGVLYSQGASSEALIKLQDAKFIWHTLNDIAGQAKCLSNIANIQTNLGEYHDAIISLTEAYELHHTHSRNARSETFILINLARLHSLNNQLPLAIEVNASAIRTALDLPDRAVQATLHLNQGTYYLASDELERAGYHLQESLGHSRQLGYKAAEMNALDSLGVLHARQGNAEAAENDYLAALELCAEVNDARVEMGTRLNLGRLYLTLRPEQAGEQLTRALELARQSHSPQEEAGVHEALATLLEGRGDFAAAIGHLREQRRIERELQDTEQQRQTRNLTVQFEVERARHDAETYRLRTEVEQQARVNAELLVKERTGELARAQQEVVTRLAMAAEYRDENTGDHTRRVGRVAARIALALGWSTPRAGTLGVAARLHDVGKIGIPDIVLLKPGRLTDTEFQQMRTHATIGARILSGGQSELLRFAEEIALTHHEHWDGRGYPAGLRGEAIPLAGRIVAIADVFDALTHSRPYKPAWTVDQAISEIERNAGHHFDPHLVAVASDILRDSARTEDETESGKEPGLRNFQPENLPFTQEDTSQVLTVFEQLLVERTRELELARRAAVEVGESMKHTARTDGLTGLANRRAFETDLEVACGGEERPLTVISLDLDGLKTMNDSRGHEQGDLFLGHFSQAVEQHFAGAGRVYRIGGDEFAVIMPGSPSRNDLDVVLRAVADEVAGSFPDVGMSYGTARFPQEAHTPGDLLRLSDHRMYTNKVQRRDRRN